MKTTIKTTTILLLLLSFTNICAQNERKNFPEKLSLLFNNEVKIVIESSEILKIPKEAKQDSLFRNLITDISKVEDSLSSLTAPLLITYTTIKNNSRKLKVNSNTDVKAEFIFTGNSDTVVSGFFNYTIECRLDMNNRLILYTNSLSGLNGLSNVSFIDIIQQAQTDISGRKIPAYKAKTCSYQIKNNNLDISSAEIKKKGTFFIVPSADLGISYLNENVLANLSFSVGYVFSPKTEIKSILGLAFEAYVNTDPNLEYMMQENYFVDVFYNIKFPNHPFFYMTDSKIFAGYLVHREGEIFPENTWRFGFDMPAGKHFRIKVAGYNNNFNDDNGGLFEIGINYKLF